METAYDQEAKLTEEGKTRVKEIFMTIMQREIMKAYKIPNDVSSRSVSTISQAIYTMTATHCFDGQIVALIFSIFTTNAFCSHLTFVIHCFDRLSQRSTQLVTTM